MTRRISTLSGSLELLLLGTAPSRPDRNRRKTERYVPRRFRRPPETARD